MQLRITGLQVRANEIRRLVKEKRRYFLRTPARAMTRRLFQTAIDVQNVNSIPVVACGGTAPARRDSKSWEQTTTPVESN
jgi:hypothetical protein